MELKESAVIVLLSSFLVLLLGIIMNSMIFYAAFIIALSAFIIDYLWLAYQAGDLKKNLAIKRELSFSELHVGTPTVLTSTLSYAGKARWKAVALQPFDELVGDDATWVIEISRDSPARLETKLTPQVSGNYIIGPLKLTIESRLFKDSLHLGDELRMVVYLPISMQLRRYISLGSSMKGLNIFNLYTIKRGSGSDFSSIRKYEPGDSIKNIDWGMSSRSGSLLVREYEDEYYWPIYIVLDTGSSMVIDEKHSALSAALDLSSFLINRTLTNNEKVGIICFDGQDITHYRHLSTGIKHVNDIRNLLSNIRSSGNSAHTVRIDTPVVPLGVKYARGDACLGKLIPMVEETFHEHMVNVKSDGFSRAVTMISTSAENPCHLVVITSLSMGMIGLMNGIRIAKYYGHQVSVVLIPHTWHEEKELTDMEIKDNLLKLNSIDVNATIMYPGERSEDVIRRGRIMSIKTNIRR